MFLQTFEKKYLSKLGKRYQTFYLMFDYLEKLKKENYYIIETGMARTEDNYDGDGLSTLLFDEYLNSRNGILHSVDINPKTLEFAAPKVSGKTKLFCQDSVTFLHTLANKQDLPKIDLLYLDSYDLDWGNPHPSAMHHIKELLAIMPKLSAGTLLVVDDNAKDAGKGKYISEYMKNIKTPYYFNDYQTGWIL